MADSLSELAGSVRTGGCSASELIEESINRIEAVNPTLNFLAATAYDQALAAASDPGRLGAGGPLDGLPLLVKDLEDVTGLATRQGSLLSSSEPATATSPSVAKLVAAGAIIVGKATLPEFAIEGFTSSRLHGSTGNPWVPALSPGGSSGGSAAALSCGAVAIATATDGGGSARIPAAFCGLLGLKPTNGLIGRWPAPDWLAFSTDGFMTTSAADLRLLATVMAGPVSGDPTALPLPAVSRVLAQGLPKAKSLFACVRTSALGEVSPAISTLLDEAVSAISSLLGVEPHWLAPGSLFEGTDPDLDWFILATTEHLSAIRSRGIDPTDPSLHVASRAFFDQGAAIDVEHYLVAARNRFEHVRSVDELLGSNGILVTPTVISEGWMADGRLTEDGEPAELPPSVYNTALANMTGHPALSIPAGILPNGLPFGVQVIAPRYSDGWLLDLAERFEERFPWPRHAPGFHPLSNTSNKSNE